MEQLKMQTKDEEYRKAHQHGGSGTGTGTGRQEKIVIDVEETIPGYVATTLKAADQMSGQTFNDVGQIDREGHVRLDRDDRHGKM